MGNGETVITSLFESVHSNASVALCSGHRDHKFFAAYQNLRDTPGAQHQEYILGGSSVENAVCSTDGSVSVAKNSTSIPNSSNATVTGISTNPSDRLSAASGRALFLSHIAVVSGNFIVYINYSIETK